MACSILGISTVLGVAARPLVAAHQSLVAPSGTEPRPPHLDVLALTGFLSAVALLICWAHRREGRRFVLGCALAGAVAAGYCLLQGAWPIGLVQAVWAVAALRRWWRAPADGNQARAADVIRLPSTQGLLAARSPWTESAESRVTRLFGAK